MRHATRRIMVAAALGLAVGMAGRAEAGILVTFNPDGSGEVGPYGQSVTTPTGGPFNDISFLVFNRDGNSDPVTGTLFILTQEYLGTPGNLSSATAGFLASTSTSSGREYSFDSAVTLDGDTQYFFYTNQPITFKVTVDGYAGGTGYLAPGTTTNFQKLTGDTNFQLSGTPVAAVPEPATLGMASVAGAVGLVGLWLRRRRAA